MTVETTFEWPPPPSQTHSYTTDLAAIQSPRGMTQNKTEKRDPFFISDFQKPWPWQRQNIWKKAESVRKRDFSTSLRLGNDSLGFGEKKTLRKIRGLGGLWIPKLEPEELRTQE